MADSDDRPRTLALACHCKCPSLAPPSLPRQARPPFFPLIFCCSAGIRSCAQPHAHARACASFVPCHSSPVIRPLSFVLCHSSPVIRPLADECRGRVRRTLPHCPQKHVRPRPSSPERHVPGTVLVSLGVSCKRGFRQAVSCVPCKLQRTRETACRGLAVCITLLSCHVPSSRRVPCHVPRPRPRPFRGHVPSSFTFSVTFPLPSRTLPRPLPLSRPLFHHVPCAESSPRNPKAANSDGAGCPGHALRLSLSLSRCRCLSLSLSFSFSLALSCSLSIHLFICFTNLPIFLSEL